jgi:hypothetical protein
MAKSKGFYLGGVIDPRSGKRTKDAAVVSYDPSDLTTHGVIVGMTGSGKTGLGIIFLEEALRAGIPALILDPKGDMTNLLLTFPELQPDDFLPWVDAAEAEREDGTPEKLAAETAELWKRGLASWDLDGDDIAALRADADFTVFTPGSEAGVPLNVMGSLAAPAVDFTDEAETIRDEIEGFVTGILGLVGIQADPLSSREHILLSNLIERSWAGGDDLTLEALLGQVHRPPLRKLGVFDIDTFFPPKDRMELAMQLNALVASPSFASWRSGADLDIERLLWTEDGTPRASILYLAHLSDDERQFVVTLVLSKMITWMRSQAGSSDLRALIYMDEVFGFVPPTAVPPAKKPILTILKQARAFGVGMLLSTQNPVDLDYKAMSNAGTWCIGRLQTARDKARIVEALQSARGDTDVDGFDEMISGLDKRQFVLHNTRDPEPTVFTTRWAMSYLRGPLTRDQIADLTAGDPARTAASSERTPPPEPAPAEDESLVVPEIADGTPVRYLDPGAPWADEVGAARRGTRYEAGLAARVHLVFDEARAGVDHDEVWEAVLFPLTESPDPADAVAVDYDERDLLPEPPGAARYVLPEAPIHTKTFFTATTRAIKDHLYRHRSIEVYRNPALKLYARVGEDREAFAARCDTAAQDEADKEAAKIRDRFEGKMETLYDQIEAARLRIDELVVDVDARRQEELLSGAGTLIGVLTGRRSTRSLGSAAGKRSMTKRTEQRLRTAEAKYTDRVEDLEDLKEDLQEEILEIDAEWRAKASEIEAFEIGLEKTDISVEEVTLLWIPRD